MVRWNDRTAEYELHVGRRRGFTVSAAAGAPSMIVGMLLGLAPQPWAAIGGVLGAVGFLVVLVTAVGSDRATWGGSP